jgi:hypothetical protein
MDDVDPPPPPASSSSSSGINTQAIPPASSPAQSSGGKYNQTKRDYAKWYNQFERDKPDKTTIAD